MKEVQQKINEILLEKQTKILPENIKKGVNILGVDGTANVPTPIYNISDWVSVNIPELNSMDGSISRAVTCYPYILIDYHVNSGVVNSYIYIIKINNGVSEVLYTENGYFSNYSSSSLFGYDNRYLYFYLGTSSACTMKKLDLNTNEVSDTTGTIQINYMYNYPYIINNNLILKPYIYRSGSYPAQIYKISNNGDTVETLYTFPNSILESVRMLTDNIFWDTKNKKIYKITEENNVVSVAESPSSLSINNFYGINLYGTKIFADDGIYNLSSTFSLGEKIADYTLKESLYCQRRKLLYRKCI